MSDELHQHEPLIGDGMDDVRDNLRRLIVRLRAEKKIESLEEWCRRAGMNNSGRISYFLSGKIRAPNLTTLISMAKVVELPVSALIGDLDKQELLHLVADFLANQPDADRRDFMAALLHAAAAAETTPPRPRLRHSDWRTLPGPPRGRVKTPPKPKK